MRVRGGEASEFECVCVCGTEGEGDRDSAKSVTRHAGASIFEIGQW